MTIQEKVQWCIDQHRNTNHMYDKYLPYEFHLRMVVQVFNDFKHLIEFNQAHLSEEILYLACWGHDLIEDTRCSYNDVKENLGYFSADIIYALTNEKGRNRAERGNDEYYEGIRNTPGAIFVKLCDRIANVQYSKMTKSRMFEMYKKENPDFLSKVGADNYPEMRDYLINLFSDENRRENI